MTLRDQFSIVAFTLCVSIAGAAWGQTAPAVTLSPDDVHGKAGIKCEGCHSKPGPNQFAAVGPANVAAVCAQCHVREADFFLKSPKKVIFEALQMPACVTCHTNHSVTRPTDAGIGFKEPAVCATCHTEEGKGADTIRALSDGLGRISGSIDRASQLLERAETAGMLVDDGHAALRKAREQQVLGRVAIHAFNPQPLTDTTATAVAAAGEAEAVANQALGELRFRRQGLAVATILILGFLITLGMKIRRLPPIS